MRFAEFFDDEKLIFFKVVRLASCSGDVIICMGGIIPPPGEGNCMDSEPGRIRCSGTSPPPTPPPMPRDGWVGEVGDCGEGVELGGVAQGEVEEFRSELTPRPEPGLADRSQALAWLDLPDPRSVDNR